MLEMRKSGTQDSDPPKELDPEKLAEIQQLYIEAYKKIFEDYTKAKCYAVFSHGSIVLYEEQFENIELIKEKAIEDMKKFGPVFAGTPSGDFNVVPVQEKFGGGWLVTSWNQSIYTLVLPDKKDELGVKKGSNEMVIGLGGRGKRQLDSEALEIIHIEIKE